MSARKTVEEVLTPAMTKDIWSFSYDKVLPIVVANFDISAVLPAVFYMFRFGHRRGKGRFLKEYAVPSGTLAQRRRSITIEAITKRLASKDGNGLGGFDDDTKRAILGDLLLCYCLENFRNYLGRTRHVQRVAPTHYMSSWVDLPENVANLRRVPEMMVAMLANQKKNVQVQRTQKNKKTWFLVGHQIHDNVLLKPFIGGVTQKEIKDDYSADQFDESSVGIDDLLMIRLAQSLRQAPVKMLGKSPGISNQRPIATQAAKNFSEDIRKFVRSYANEIPRQAFVELLESCLAIGLASITTSSVELVINWAKEGDIIRSNDQKPAPFFVDCSMGVERSLKELAEQSMGEFMGRARRFPIVLMALRLLDYKARYDPKIKKQVSSITLCPQADDWLRLLGNVLHGRHKRSDAILDSLDEMAEKLAEEVEEDYREAAAVLKNDEVETNPVWRLAEGLILLQGKGPQNQLDKLIDSAIFVDRPNGLAAKRRARRKVGGSPTPRTIFLRSLRLTDAVLDYLVHRLLLRSGGKSGIRWLSFGKFTDILQKRYGFYIDTSPPGITVSNDLLQLNRAYLDRRLRDLGLLASVNDAEGMKCLTPRFKPTEI